MELVAGVNPVPKQDTLGAVSGSRQSVTVWAPVLALLLGFGACSDDDPASACKVLAAGNAAGVGAACTSAGKDLACPVTKVCTEDGRDAGAHVQAPYYCTRTCTTDDQCGTGANCCQTTAGGVKQCVLKGCPGTCGP